MLGLHLTGGSSDAGLVIDVELQGSCREPLPGQVCDRRAGAALISRADDHDNARFCELTGNFQPDPLVCAGNEGNTPAFHG